MKQILALSDYEIKFLKKVTKTAAHSTTTTKEDKEDKCYHRHQKVFVALCANEH